MNPIISLVASVYVGILCFPAYGQQPDVPIELRNLMEQYQTKLKADAKPVTEKLLSEMKKLEQRLIKDNRLSDALVVQKTFKEMSAAADSGRADDQKTFVHPKTADELKKAMTNSIWAFKHAGNGTIMNVVLFHEDGSCVIASAINGRWKVIEKDKVEVSATNLPQTAIMNFSDKSKYTYQYGSGDVLHCEFYGRFSPKTP